MPFVELDARVKVSVNQVGREVCHDEEDGNDEDACAHQWVVANLYRVIDEQAHPGPGKDNFNEDSSAHQASKAHAEHGYRRNEGILECIFVSDQSLRKARGAGSAYIGLVQYL